MFYEDQELQDYFTIGGLTREEWSKNLCTTFAKSVQVKELLQNPDISPQHINAPIKFFTQIIFLILQHCEYDPCKQYQLSIGLANICHYTDTEFKQVKSALSPIESFKAIRFAALKKERATTQKISSQGITFPIASKEAYLDYISDVANQCTRIIAEAFQKHDVAIEVVNDYNAKVQEQYSKMTWAEKADAKLPNSSSAEEILPTKQRNNVTWQETVQARGITTDIAKESLLDGTLIDSRYTNDLARDESGEIMEWEEKLNDKAHSTLDDSSVGK